MFIVIGDQVINFDNVKCFHIRADHIIIEFNDHTIQEFVFNSEPEAHQAFIQLAQKLATDEVENCEAAFDPSALQVQADE